MSEEEPIKITETESKKILTTSRPKSAVTNEEADSKQPPKRFHSLVKEGSTIPIPTKNITSKKTTPKPIVNYSNRHPTKARNDTNDRQALELQFGAGLKQFQQMHTEYLSRQKPIIKHYNNLLAKKQKLEELGRNVKLGELKFMTYIDDNELDIPEGEHSKLFDDLKTAFRYLQECLTNAYDSFQSKSGETSAKLGKKKHVQEANDEEIKKNLEMMVHVNRTKILHILHQHLDLQKEMENREYAKKVKLLEEQLKQQEALILTLTQTAEKEHEQLLKEKDEQNKISNELNLRIKILKNELESNSKEILEEHEKHVKDGMIIRELKEKIEMLTGKNQSLEWDNKNVSLNFAYLKKQLDEKEVQWAMESNEKDSAIDKLMKSKQKWDKRFITTIVLKILYELFTPHFCP